MENENEISGNIIHRNPVNMPKMDRKLRNCYEDELFKKMLENDPAKRMTSKEVVDQLKSIKDKLAGKEKELLQLCGRDTQLDLTEQIKNFILFGINLNAKDNDGSNALHLLCRYYSSSKLIDAIKIVIQSGINVNAKDKCGRNALHYLCRFNLSSNLIDAIQNLILAGINVNEKGNNGWNALHYLCFFHSSPKLLNAIESLIKHGINLNAEVEDGQNALHLLCQVSDGSPNFVDVIQLLIQHGIDTNAKNKNGCNALHFLCQNNSSAYLRDAIKLLIQQGIDVNAKDKDGRNALHYLCRHNSSTNLRDAIQILFQYGIDVNKKDNHEWNALNFLVRNNMDKYLKSDVFRFLIRHGVQVHNENDEASAKTFKKLFQDFFKENENNGKKCFDFLVEEKIRLGWHDACEHCQQILSIEESPRARLWHHQMFSSCYLVFDSLMEELEKWAKSSINKFGESELDIKNPTEWLRGIAEEYQQNTTDKSYKEDFEVMADVSEQVKDGNNSSHFNCDNYERYLRSMYSIAEMTDSKESMGHIKWCYLLPFDYSIDKDYGKFMTEDANDGFFLPKEFKYKCHGEL
ncbi:hypothetical protein OUZ56_017594 [Daphnia magna]|uniref:Ankyrin repeat protein n=1 Tax=Daphnia magna TaxID=35525 RepID=A0ABR0AT70_9CRUS|nr:hypothetical protein OUZ56_017594 [Daphnia magna]